MTSSFLPDRMLMLFQFSTRYSCSVTVANASLIESYMSLPFDQYSLLDQVRQPSKLHASSDHHSITHAQLIPHRSVGADRLGLPFLGQNGPCWP